MPLFDRDRYQRLPLDVSGGGVGGSGARRPSSSCTTATIVLFVGLCLVGAWMMASTSSVPISVSPENKSEAKEEDRSVDLINSVNGAGVGGGDTPQTTEDVVDAGKNDDGPGGTPETSTDDAGDTDKKDDGGGATQTTDAAAAGSDVSQSSVAETVDAAANSTIGGEGKLAGDTVARGEAPSNNQTFSDENGTTEGGELVNPEDPDKKAENSASEATTGVQPDKSTEQNTDEAPRDAKGTGDQVDTDSEKASPDGDNTETGDQVDTNSEKASPDGDTTENGDQVDEISEKASPDGDTTETGNQVDKNSEKASPDGDTTATGAQVDKISEKASPDGDTTETGDQVDKISEKASPDGDTTETGGQDEKNAEAAPTSETKKTGGQVTKITVDKDAEETPAYAKDAGDDGTAKNQTAFDDQNGNLDGDQNGEKARATDDDDTAGAGGASKNQTLGVGDQNDVLRNQTFAAVHGTINGTLSQEAETVATDSSAIAEDEPVISEPETVELLPSGQAELLNETAAASAQSGTFPTQATESSEEKKARASREKKNNNKNKNNGSGGETSPRVWKLCNVTAGADYIPCLDNEAAIKGLKSTKHYEHRERHCPSAAPECLVPLPEGYRRPIPWPHSRDKIWYHNVPHTKLASYKGNQNWVKVSGEHLVFPGGGTQFTNGASHYIDVIQEALPEVAWGRRSRVVLDVGCGVASFGGYLFDRDALTMSFAPKDEHEAQVQFALERGIPAISAVMGTRRLPFPSGAFDLVHCARCRVPWHIEGGKLLLELNRLLRPGGLFVWSATPVYRKNPEDVGIWQAMAALTKSMCWEMVKRTSDTVDQTAMVIFKKPSSNDCYDKRQQPEPPLCDDSDDPNAAWNVTLQSCMHRVPTDPAARGSRWPGQWPERLTATPYWLGDGQVGAYGKPAPDDFAADSEHWRRAVNNSYLAGMGIDWSDVRNVMDMRAVYGGFAAALRDMKVWVMNVVTVDSPDTLPIIYERGLFGMYHDWCESFSTYPRTYDLVHADHLFSKIKDRCKLLPVITEVDRILRPEGKLIVRDDRFTVEEVEEVTRSLHWEVAMDVSKETERLLCFKKTMWRPTEVEALS